MASTTYLTLEGRRVKVSSLDKVLYPTTGFTKRDVLDYYSRIGPVMSEYLKGRIVTLKRYPDGVAGEVFFQKRCPAGRPSWVQTAKVWSETNHAELAYCVLDDVPSLVWAANLGALELHVSLARTSDYDRPTSLVFDLDPGPPATILECLQVAFWLRELCAQVGLQAFPKVSGSKGIHLHIPLNSPASYEQTKPFAHALAERLEESHPELVVANMRRELREGRVLIDWSQNEEHKTTVCVYSLRGKERPTVSMPVTWDELEEAHAVQDTSSLVYSPDQALVRLEEVGDLYAPVRELHQDLPSLSRLQAA
jgi:bifunctional non-homologous end joining protein LigD